MCVTPGPYPIPVFTSFPVPSLFKALIGARIVCMYDLPYFEKCPQRQLAFSIFLFYDILSLYSVVSSIFDIHHALIFQIMKPFLSHFFNTYFC